MANKNRHFKNFTKISEIKDINGILCAILIIILIISTILGVIEYRQQKTLAELEDKNKPIDQQVAESRDEIKNYFSKYIKSDQYKKDFKEKTGISDILYAALEQAGLVPQLQNDDLNDIIDQAEKLLKESPKMASIDSIIYQDLYNELYKRVITNIRKNIYDNNVITIEQRKEYDIEKIIAEVEARIRIPSNTTNPSEIITTAYVEGIVETILKEYEISDSDIRYLRDKISKDVLAYLNSEEGKKLYPNGNDGKDGKDGKDGIDGKNGKDGENGEDGADGKEIIKGVDYFTKEDIREITEILTMLLSDYINAGEITVKGERGYSVTDIQRNKSIITITSGRNKDEIQTTSIMLPEIPSIESIQYTEYNMDNDNSENIKDGVLSVKYKDTSTGTYKTENISVNTLSNAVTNSIIVNLIELFKDFPLNNDIYFDFSTGTAYCRKCSTFDDKGYLITGVPVSFNNNGTDDCITDDYYQCPNDPDHKYHKISIDSLKAELEEMLKLMKNLPIPGEQTDTDNLEDAKDQIISNILAQYESLLDSMNSREYYNTIMGNPKDIPYLNNADINTVFEYYDKVMINVGGKNYYGTQEDLTDKIASYNTLHPVIVGYLLDKGYIIEDHETMELNFAGENDYEKLNNAFDSKIVELFESLSEQVFNYDQKILADGEQETNRNPVDGTVEKELEDILEVFKAIEKIYSIVRYGIIEITINSEDTLNLDNKMEIIYTSSSPMFDYLSALYFNGIEGNPQVSHKLPLEITYADNTIPIYPDDEMINQIHGKISGITGAYLEKIRDISGTESFRLTVYKDPLININNLSVRISILH